MKNHTCIVLLLVLEGCVWKTPAKRQPLVDWDETGQYDCRHSSDDLKKCPATDSPVQSHP